MDEMLIREIAYNLTLQNPLDRLNTITQLHNNGIDGITDISFDFPKSNFSHIPAQENFGSYAICGLCDYSKTIVLNNDYISGNRELATKLIAVLDLNVISNINKAIRKQNYPEAVDKDSLCDLMTYLFSKDFDFVLSPALGERAVKTGETKDYIQSDMIENFLKYIHLDDITDPKQEIALSDTEIQFKKAIFDSSIKYRTECFEKGADKHYLSILCLITKAYIIKHLEKSNDPIQDLYEYCLSNLVYLDPELTALSLWFQNDSQANKTFEKLNPSSKDIIEKLKNQSWDIYHLRLAESFFQFVRVSSSRDEIWLPYFICRDIGLTNYFRINPIVKFVVADNTIYSIRKYSIKDFDMPLSSDKDVKERLNRVNMYDLVAERDRLFDIINNHS